MKKYNLITLAFALLLFASCEDEWVEIDSLQVFGDEFYQGATVNLGMAVETSDPDKNYYEWYAEAGSLRMANQGYTVMKWTAPRRNGEFIVGCTVYSGGAKQTREAAIRINGIFFDRFANSTLSSWTATNSTARWRSGRMEAFVAASNTADSMGWVSKAIGTTIAATPASANARVGIVGGSQNGNNPKFPETVINPEWDNFLGFGMQGAAVSTEEPGIFYINEVRVDWWPSGHANSVMKYYAPEDAPEMVYDPTRTINTSSFNAMVTVGWTRTVDVGASQETYSGWFRVPFSHSAFTHGADEDLVVGIATGMTKIYEAADEDEEDEYDTDYTVYVYANNEMVFQTDAIQTFVAANVNQTEPVYFRPNRVKYVYPNFTWVYMNSVVVNNGVEVLN